MIDNKSSNIETQSSVLCLPGNNVASQTNFDF